MYRRQETSAVGLSQLSRDPKVQLIAEILAVLLCGLAWPFSLMVTFGCLCSPIPQERLGGILAIDELIDVKVSSGSWMEIYKQSF